MAALLRRRARVSRPRRGSTSAILQALLVVAPTLASAAAGPLRGHSFSSPPEINSLASEWFLAGTAIPSTSSLVLGPGVPNRIGLVWSRYPLLTSDFEVTVTFTAERPSGTKTTNGDGFAIWYVYENVTEAQGALADKHVHNQEEMISNTWDVAMRSGGFDLLGYRNAFNGMGVFFCDDAGAPSVSTVVGDGNQSYALGSGLPANESLKVDYRGGAASPTTVKIRVHKTGIKVTVGDKSQDLNRELRSGGYLGFSIFGGRKGVLDATEKSDFVMLQKVEVENMDAAAEGENIPQAAAPPAGQAASTGAEKEDVLASSSSYRDHRAESAAIKDLTDMVFKLVMETQPMRAELQTMIDSLGRRIEAMEETFDKLKLELDKKTGHNLGKEFEAIKQELASLSAMASHETQRTHSQLDSLHQDIAHVHKSAHSEGGVDEHLSKLANANQQTIDSLSDQHQKMFGVSIVAIAFVIIAGLSLYNKFRCWEKKHCL